MIKKETIFTLITWAIIIGGMLTFFLCVINPYGSSRTSDVMRYGDKFGFILFFFGAMVTGIVVNAFVFELAHVIGAKMGRYDVLSINVLGINLYKDNGRWKVRFSSFDGLTGETKIIPKTGQKKEPNPSSFLLAGSIFYGFEIIIVLTLFFSFKNHVSHLGEDWLYFALTSSVTGGGMLIYNIFPFRIDSLNDGYRLSQVGKRENRKAFNACLKAEITGEVVSLEDNKEQSVTKINNFSSDIEMNKAYLLMNENKMSEALVVLDGVLHNQKAPKKVKESAWVQIAFINIINKSLIEAKEYYDQFVSLEKRHELSQDNSIGGIRTYILMAGLLDKSSSECYRVLAKAKKAYLRVPEQRRHLEQRLFNEALDRVINSHPNWELEEFRI